MDELFIVGIASSAGGLTPLTDLISNAICHKNMTFILVPHLSREHKSDLPSLMKRFSKLKIIVIKHEMVIEPCSLYILPPGYYARVVKGKICLDRRPIRGVNQAADVLFKSLAEAYGKCAIGVVLSGAGVGSDGSEGIVHIKKHHGHTYAQDPATAQFPEMPLFAIETGCVDLVLIASEIGHDLGLVSSASDLGLQK